MIYHNSFCVTLRILVITAFLFVFTIPALADEVPFTVETPETVLNGIEFSLTITPATRYYMEQDDFPMIYRVLDESSGTVLAEGSEYLDARNPSPIVLKNLKSPGEQNLNLRVTLGGHTRMATVRVISAFWALLPALIAIVLALITRQVLIALFCGVWLGATVLNEFNPMLGFLRTLDQYIVNGLANTDHIFILTFSLVLGGMVGVISRSGGTEGIVAKLSEYADDSRKGQVCTWLMGILIFFDDYANTLIVGNTMRPLTDKLHISREKLAYLVDSTAAPVANIAVISTWVGYEISLLDESFKTLGLDKNAYITFLETIPYNFYPIFALAFGLFIALTMRDFGPMWHAERRASTRGEVIRLGARPLADFSTADMLAEPETPKRWYNAVVPVAVAIISVIAGLIYTGWDEGWQALAISAANEGIQWSDVSFTQKLSAIIGASDSFPVLLWAAFAGSVVAIIMALSQRILSLRETMDAWRSGVGAMMGAALILTAAWAIGAICKDLYTADYVVQLTRPLLSAQMLPLFIFLTAAMIAFATGTSWGTMAILMPIAVPLAYRMPQLAEPMLDEHHAGAILLGTIAAVLAGATFGDHCSPISDTTILSSMATNSDHIDHVRTQMPYALTVGAIACLFGYLPAGLGLSNWLLLPLGIAAAYAVIHFGGRRIDFDQKWRRDA